ncbi:hypothetical protein BVRB_6g136090 isoform A [Beta vulgaris subsp. vulgaris]|nr:hypothetical protein BVRB_6g136090 isoform A [Beta vulgaris subsp. vulgaris]
MSWWCTGRLVDDDVAVGGVVAVLGSLPKTEKKEEGKNGGLSL